MDPDLSHRTVNIDSHDEHVFRSVRAAPDVALNCDPESMFWKEAHGVDAELDAFGRRYEPPFTRVLSRWTRANLYVLFACPYEVLYVKPQPVTDRKTFGLWEWDVAELFISSDFEKLRQYKEFEVSPQGEWVDLEVNLDLPDHTVGWRWNSGFEVAARIDAEERIWRGAMRIPFAAIDVRDVETGRLFRANLCRSEGPHGRRKLIAWRAPMNDTFHVPERFGSLELVDG